MLRPATNKMCTILDKFAYIHRNSHDTCKNLEQYRWELVLEVAKHFEDGAKKYGDRNWEKGIPCDRYINSAVRHYCKWRAGWTDEPHDRAFIWNILCCEWTRQRYGWNLERLKKIEHDKAKSESKEFVKISEQLARGARASMESMNRLAVAISKSPFTIHVKKEDIRNEDILRQINEQEIADLKAACDVAKRYTACSNTPTDVCCTRSCMDCEHNVESEDIAKALNRLADYFKKSLKNTEAKDQETATLKEACVIIERHNACFDSPTEVCRTKMCNDCEHYIDPDITHKAVNRLLEHAKKSLENTEAK